MYNRTHRPRKAAETSSDSKSDSNTMQVRPFTDDTQPQAQSASTSEHPPVAGFNLGQIPIFPPQNTAVHTKQVADPLIQRQSDDSPSATHASPSPYQVGWSDAASGAASKVTQAPKNKGWNEDKSNVGKILRIPIQGLKQGNQNAAMSNRPKKDGTTTHVASQESAAGRAIVLIPDHLVQQINTAQPIEVLLHFHGHNIAGEVMTDYRQQKSDGTVYDVEYAKIEQQLEASNRPMMAVLPEGTSTSKFGDFNSDAYLKEVYDALVQTDVLKQKPNVQRIALSGHSGGGDAIARLLNSKNAPTQMADLILFDGINDKGKATAAKAWVKSRLRQDLAYLTSGIPDADQLQYLETSSRFRGYYTSGNYEWQYKSLREEIDQWLDHHADQLGGSSSAVYNKLKDNYQTIPVGHKDHFRVMSDPVKQKASEGQAHQSPLLDALNALPANTLPSSAGSLTPTGSTQTPATPAMVPPTSEQSAPIPTQPQNSTAQPAQAASNDSTIGNPLGAIAHLLMQVPQLALNVLEQVLGGKSKPIQTVTDRKALIRTSPPDLTSMGQTIPQGSQVEILQTHSQDNRDFALVQQVMPAGVAGPPMLWGWTLKSNLSGAKAEEKDVPAGENSHTDQPPLINQPVPAPTEFKKVKFGRSLPQVDAVLELAGQKPDEWFSSFTSITFLGRPLKTPIHTSLAAHLKAVEAKFAAQYGSAEAAGQQFGLTEHVAGSREKSQTAEYSMHIFGLAIDLDPSKNPYIANGKKTMASTNKVFHRVGMLLNNEPLQFEKFYGSDIKKAYAQNQILDTALEEYFSYGQELPEKKQKLAALLQNTKAPEWQGKTPEEARAIIKKDIEICAALWARKGKEDQVAEHGMMSLKEELVVGMELDWGGRYGDFMHFDMRNQGIGKDVYESIAKYKKQLEKEKKEGKS